MRAPLGSSVLGLSGGDKTVRAVWGSSHLQAWAGEDGGLDVDRQDGSEDTGWLWQSI